MNLNKTVFLVFMTSTFFVRYWTVLKKNCFYYDGWPPVILIISSVLFGMDGTNFFVITNKVFSLSLNGTYTILEVVPGVRCYAQQREQKRKGCGKLYFVQWRNQIFIPVSIFYSHIMTKGRIFPDSNQCWTVTALCLKPPIFISLGPKKMISKICHEFNSWLMSMIYCLTIKIII